MRLLVLFTKSYHCFIPILHHCFLGEFSPLFQYFGLLSLENGTGRLSRTVVKNYHYSLRNDPEERSSPIIAIT